MTIINGDEQFNSTAG